MRRTSLFSTILTALALLAVLTLACGCGKKAWPEPATPEDAFSFTGVSGEMSGNCLTVRSRLAGNWHNVSSLYIELSWDDCTDCPFKTMTSREFVPGSDVCTIDAEGRLTITACGMDPAVRYRWRLVGRNVHRTLRDVRSGVMATIP